MNLQREFGQRVRVLRQRLGITQRELARRCGGKFVTQRVGEIERGHMNCTLQTVAGLCKGLRCEPLDLFLFEPGKSDEAPSLPNRRLRDLWNAADEKTKQKMLRILAELL
jgi:transcriptional regulator with XRE-family HTH domain